MQSPPPPSRPPRNPARTRSLTGTSESGGQKSPTITFSDIVLIRRHKSTGARIKQPLSKVVSPGVNAITLHPLKLTRRDTTPTRHDIVSPSRSDFAANAALKLMQSPRLRPSSAPHPPSSYPRSLPGTPGPCPSSFRPPNPALARLLATKPPPPPPPLPHQHQRAVSLHPQPPYSRVRNFFSTARPFPNSDSHASLPSPYESPSRPTSAYTSIATLDTTTRNITKSLPSPISVSTPKQKSKPAQFSTADRTILEELRRNISAKAAQFVVKGNITGGSIGLGRRGGGRHHPFSKEEVPYPRCYEREAVDLDVWETAFCEQLCESVTWHVFEEPPTKVLDIGSGTGTWILNCARLWKSCHFVGLDIVPLHPDLQQVGSPDLAARITWVQENFLNGLPFPNEEFDFVHIKRIARGVPEDKWDSLFEEITRVMKPGGAFEMLEEDLFFPGIDPDSDGEIVLEFPKSINDKDTDTILTNSSASELPAATPMKVGETTTTGVGATLLGMASLGATLPSTQHSAKSSSGPEKLWRLSRSSSLKDPGCIQQPLSRYDHPVPGYGQAALSTTSLSSDPAHSYTRQSTSSSLTMVSHTATAAVAATSVPSASTAQQSPRTPTGQDSMFFVKTLPIPPVNPRDHRLLEVIYTEMHAARFINLSPLSLLANTLGLHFKDVRTHLPLELNFPPRSKARTCDSGEARHGKDYSQWLTRKDLLERASPYVRVDDTVLSAMLKPGLFGGDTGTKSPSPMNTKQTPVGSPRGTQPDAGTRWAPSRLPNSKLRFDLRSLNLHLALRAAETLGCAEAMWEWVVDYQAARVTNQGPAKGDDMIKEAIKTLSRADFDALLTKFDLDMRDHVGMEHALRERFSWGAMPSTPSTERKVFDTACGEWEHEQEERHRDNGARSISGNCEPGRRLGRAIRVFIAWKGT